MAPDGSADGAGTAAGAPSGSAPGGTGNTGSGEKGGRAPVRVGDVIRYENRKWPIRYTWGRVLFTSASQGPLSGDVGNKWRIFLDASDGLRVFTPQEAGHLILNVARELASSGDSQILSLPEGETDPWRIYRNLLDISQAYFSTSISTAHEWDSDGNLSVVFPDTWTVVIENPHSKFRATQKEVARLVASLPLQFSHMIERITLIPPRLVGPGSGLTYNSSTLLFSNDMGLAQMKREIVRVASFKLFATHDQPLLWVLATYADETMGYELDIGSAIANDAITFVFKHHVFPSGNPAVTVLFLSLLCHRAQRAFERHEIQAAIDAVELGCDL